MNKKKGFILVYVLILLNLISLALVALFFRQKTQNKLLFVENQSIEDYYKGEAAILYAIQNAEFFDDYFIAWQKELKKGITPVPHEFKINNYLSDVSDTRIHVDFDYLEKCFILKNSEYKVLSKIDAVHPFFRVDQKLSKAKHDLYFDYFSSLPLNSDSRLYRYDIHNNQVLRYKNCDLVLINSENPDDPIAPEEEFSDLETGEEAVRVSDEANTSQEPDKMLLPVALSLDSNSHFIVNGEKPVELSGLFFLSGEINLEQSLTLKGIVFLDRVTISGKPLKIEGGMYTKQNKPLGVIHYRPNSKYELIYGMDIQNYFQPEIKKVHSY